MLDHFQEVDWLMMLVIYFEIFFNIVILRIVVWNEYNSLKNIFKVNLENFFTFVGAADQIQTLIEKDAADFGVNYII